MERRNGHGFDMSAPDRMDTGMAALAAIAKLFASNLDEQQVGAAVADIVLRVCQAKVVHVWVDAPEARMLDAAGSAGVKPETEAVLLEFARVPYGEGLPGRVLVYGAPIFIEDAIHDPRWLNARFIREVGLHGYAGLPLAADGERVGVLSVLYGEPRSFDAGERILLRALADYVAIAIRMGRLSALRHQTMVSPRR
jgi:GAF domain-containing protein